MAANKAGAQLSQDEVREYVAYGNAAMTAPDKYDGVVFDNSDGKAIYRYATAEESRAADDAAAAAEKAAADDAARTAKVRQEASRRATTADVPPASAPTPVPEK